MAQERVSLEVIQAIAERHGWTIELTERKIASVKRICLFKDINDAAVYLLEMIPKTTPSAG